MKGPEEEEREGESGVEQGHVVARPRQQQPHHQAHNHADVLVHAERKEVPLREGRADGHEGDDHVDCLNKQINIHFK